MQSLNILIMTICRSIHAHRGNMYGWAVRRLFFSSSNAKSSPDIDCSFDSNYCANVCLRNLQVENNLYYHTHLSHGPRIFILERTDMYQRVFRVNLRIHNYYFGNKGSISPPKHLPFPLIDIDCLAWKSNSITEILPLEVQKEELQS